MSFKLIYLFIINYLYKFNVKNIKRLKIYFYENIIYRIKNISIDRI